MKKAKGKKCICRTTAFRPRTEPPVPLLAADGVRSESQQRIFPLINGGEAPNSNFGHIQINSQLLLQKSQPVLSPRSLHSAHQPTSLGGGLLAKAIIDVTVFWFDVPWFAFIALDSRSSYCENVTFHIQLEDNLVIYCAEILPSGDIAALVYLWNPFTIVSCVGFNTSPIENLFVILSLYGASAGLIPLAAFGWVIASHLSLYPLVLIIPVIFLLGYGLDAPPRKLFVRSTQVGEERPVDHVELKSVTNKPLKTTIFSWRPVIVFFLWASIWILYVLMLCAIDMKEHGGLWEMFKRTYGFILTVKDLSPNIGVLWYFFAEVFDFFRNFFLIVFHVNILFMILPLAIRLNHRPCFLVFVYLAISSMLKSYPSGTGNANFYFATAIAYACFQIVLVVESVSAMLNYDRKIRKLCNTAKV
ncbi:UNVERIFIED_CONTAM: Phosphatidylinositol glycan anchor biosynthesis class U protein [Sesamum indicum]